MRLARIVVLIALVMLHGIALLAPHDHGCEVGNCQSRSSQQRAALTFAADQNQQHPHHCLACAVANLDYAAVVTSFDLAAPQVLSSPIDPVAPLTSIGLIVEPRQRGPPQST